jgi:gas vesicle protein
MKSSKLIISMLAGAAGGALLGILFAPDKGYETRKKLGEKADDLAGNLKGNLQDFFKSVADNFKMTKEEGIDFSEDPGEQSVHADKKLPHFLKAAHEPHL